MKLYEYAEQYRAALEHLESMDLPDEVIEDSISAIKGELTDKAEALAAFILNMDSDIEQLQAHKAKVDAAIKSKKKRQEWLKDYLRWNMESCGISKIECPLFKVSLRRPVKSVMVSDESKLPDGCIRVKREPDKTEIKKRLQADMDVPGASLVDGKAVITIKI